MINVNDCIDQVPIGGTLPTTNKSKILRKIRNKAEIKILW